MQPLDSLVLNLGLYARIFPEIFFFHIPEKRQNNYKF